MEGKGRTDKSQISSGAMGWQFKGGLEGISAMVLLTLNWSVHIIGTRLFNCSGVNRIVPGRLPICPR